VVSTQHKTLYLIRIGIICSLILFANSIHAACSLGGFGYVSSQVSAKGYNPQTNIWTYPISSSRTAACVEWQTQLENHLASHNSYCPTVSLRLITRPPAGVQGDIYFVDAANNGNPSWAVLDTRPDNPTPGLTDYGACLLEQACPGRPPSSDTVPRWWTDVVSQVRCSIDSNLKLSLTQAPNQVPPNPRPKGTEGKDPKSSSLELIAKVTENGTPKAGVAVAFKVEVKEG
jgi:hypothetical protein